MPSPNLNTMMKSLNTLALLCACGVLAACGGGGGGDGSGSADQKRFVLSVTDAPVDNAAQVVVQFSGVEMQMAGSGGQTQSFVIDPPRSIDLLAFTGLQSAQLLSTTAAPAGDYQWIRLLVDADSSSSDSYVIFDDGSEVPLSVPSGRLQLNSGFTINATGLSSFTIDFDLRKALTDPRGRSDILLRPALRLVENAEVGSIEGTADAGLFSAAGCSSDPATGTGAAVYLYAGAGVTPDDEGSAAPPLASALFSLNSGTGEFEFVIGFVPAGDYTVAFTCQAGDDTAEADEAIAFADPQDVTVVTGAASAVSFIYVPPTGDIAGEVASSLAEDASCTSGNAVYLYAGSGATTGDQGSADAPLAVATVSQDASTMVYSYGFSGVDAGDYTAAFTCQADDDDPAAGGDAISFGGTIGVTVSGGGTTTADFTGP